MHDVFVVTSRGGSGGHIARIVLAANEADARRAHQENYPGESIVDVATRVNQLTSFATVGHIPKDTGWGPRF